MKMNRFLSPLFFIMTFFILTVAGCSKRNLPSPPATEGVGTAPVAPGRCGQTTSASLLRSIEAGESVKVKYEAEVKISPAKANYKKLFDSEVTFVKEAEEALEILSHCEDPVAAPVLETLKKKVATSRANVTYLAESFPDFK